MNNIGLKTSTLMVAAFLTGCTGSAYKLPELNDAEISSAQTQIASQAGTLKLFNRTNSENEALVRRASQRLLENAQPLCNYSDYPSCYFETVYDPASTMNAYASEGYKITVFGGLLNHLETEDEVAAVIGHEMGHHLAHHNEEQRQNAQAGAAVAGIFTAILIGAANANNPYARDPYQDQRMMNNMMQVGAGIGAISYSKEQEREADLLGAYLLKRANYDLVKAQRLMLVLASNSARGTSSDGRAALLATHPAGPERYAAWIKGMQEVETNVALLPYESTPSNGDTPKKVMLAKKDKAVEDIDTPETSSALIEHASKPASAILSPSPAAEAQNVKVTANKVEQPTAQVQPALESTVEPKAQTISTAVKKKFSNQKDCIPVYPAKSCKN